MNAEKTRRNAGPGCPECHAVSRWFRASHPEITLKLWLVSAGLGGSSWEHGPWTMVISTISWVTVQGLTDDYQRFGQLVAPGIHIAGAVCVVSKRTSRCGWRNT